MAAVNPYLPPNAFVADVSTADSDAEAVRQEHIKHEASVRSIGVLYYIGGVMMVLGSLALIVAGFAVPQGGAVAGAMGVVYGAFAVLSIAVGRGLRQLRSWARTTTAVLSAIGLLGIPIGTLINGYILYLLLAEKGKRIFEPDYADIVAATPHIKYRTSLIVWLLVALLVIVIIGVVAAIAIPSLSR
jgi:hypothetical protein